MLIEAHIGSKPGAPARLVLLGAAALVTSLGIAWTQVRQSRALGPETRIGDTPLYVRPPRGWAPAPDDPRKYELIVRDSRANAKTVTQSITFGYLRRPTFLPPIEVLQILHNGEAHLDPTPARIGPFDGIEVRRKQQFAYRGYTYVQESLRRIACSPRGDVILIDYEPMTGVTLGDHELLDEICRTVRIVDGALDMPGATAQSRAGLGFVPPADWRLFGPDFADVPAVYVHPTAGQAPNWSLGVYRTWLAGPERGPRDILRDFATRAWDARGDATVIEESELPPRRVFSIRRPGGPGALSAHLCVQQHNAALIVAYGAEEAAPVANQAAFDLARELSFSDGAATTILEQRGVGAEVAQLLIENGPRAWWGIRGVRHEYVGIWNNRAVSTVLTRRREGDDYEGAALWRELRGPELAREAWTLRPNGAYARECNTLGVRGQPGAVVVEKLDAGAHVAQRFRKNEGLPRAFAIPAEFVPPPLESLAIAEIAFRERGADSTALFAFSEPYGVGWSSVEVQALGRDRGGAACALVRRDYWPRGEIQAFDADRELLYTISPDGELRRTP